MLHQMRGLGWAIAQSSAVVIGLAIGQSGDNILANSQAPIS